jgi:hypothetical protein
MRTSCGVQRFDESESYIRIATGGGAGGYALKAALQDL